MMRPQKVSLELLSDLDSAVRFMIALVSKNPFFIVFFCCLWPAEGAGDQAEIPSL
jgi:hypothetical protein